MSWLADLFEECVAERSLGVVVLRSPTGWGKTVEVAELYEVLAKGQVAPRFWPERFEQERSGVSFDNPDGDEAAPTHSLARRKRVFPANFRPPAGARMPFVWWGLRGMLDEDGSPRFAGFELDGQLREIMEPLAAAIAADERLWRDRALTVLKAVTSTTGIMLLPVGEAVRTVKELADIAAELLELVPQALGEVPAAGARTERARKARGGSTIRTDGIVLARTATERAGSILATVSHVLPTVVAVEDAQLLDDHTVAMLRTWMNSDLPVGLLVLTVASDRPGTGREWLAWWEELQRAEQVYVEDLHPLADEVLQEIALQRLVKDLPGYTIRLQAVTEVVMQAGGNPLTLHQMLDQAPVRAALVGGDPTLVAVTCTLSAGSAGDLMTAFDRFDPVTRQGLAVLSQLGRDTLLAWFEAGLRVGLDSFTDRASAVSATIGSGWCQYTEDQAVGFVDAGAYRVAVDAAAQLLDEAHLNAILQRVAALIQAAREDGDWPSLPVQVRQGALQTLLVRDGLSAEDRAALMLELYEIYLWTGQSERRSRLLDLLQQQVSLVGRMVADELVVTLSGGLLELNEPDSALHVLREHHKRLIRELGEDDVETLVAQHNLAVSLRVARQLQAAVDLLSDLLQRRLGVLSAHHEHIRDTRRDLAGVLIAQGRYAEARDQLLPLQDDDLAALGPDHRQTIADQINLAQAVRAAGDPLQAIRLLNLLAIRIGKLLPRNDLLIRRTLHQLGAAHQAAGHLGEARKFFQALLESELLILGTEHSDTLGSRRELAGLRGQAGDPAGAVAQLEELLADQLRVLGSHGPGILATRAALAYWRIDTGDLAGAAAQREELLAEQLRILGPDHPDTLVTRAELAYLSAQTGDLAGAAAQREELLAEQLRILGPDHPDTLVTRADLAALRGDLGDMAGAVSLLEALLADRIRILGPDHPKVLHTRSELAYWHSQSGDLRGAIAQRKELLADQLRILGPNHPHTFVTRSHLAAMSGRAGDLVGAVAQLEKVLSDQLRILGPDHPDIFATRSHLAAMSVRAGDLVGAVAQLEKVLSDQLRILGPDHPETLGTRSHLAAMSGRAGDLAGAVAQLEKVLADQLRILGPNHPDTLITIENLNYLRHMSRD